MQVAGDSAAFMCSGCIEVGTTPVRIFTNKTKFSRGIFLYARKDNSADIAFSEKSNLTIYSDPATDGFPLRPDTNFALQIEDLSQVWLVAEADNQVLHYVCM